MWVWTIVERGPALPFSSTLMASRKKADVMQIIRHLDRDSHVMRTKPSAMAELETSRKARCGWTILAMNTAIETAKPVRISHEPRLKATTTIFQERYEGSLSALFRESNLHRYLPSSIRYPKPCKLGVDD